MTIDDVWCGVNVGLSVGVVLLGISHGNPGAIVAGAVLLAWSLVNLYLGWAER